MNNLKFNNIKNNLKFNNIKEFSVKFFKKYGSIKLLFRADTSLEIFYIKDFLISMTFSV